MTEKMDDFKIVTKVKSNIEKQKFKLKEENRIKSLCIPRMDSKITKWEICDVIKRMNLGIIERVDEVYNYKINSKRVFIHMKKWNNNKTVRQFKKTLLENGHVNIIYNFPDFWKCYISNINKPQ